MSRNRRTSTTFDLCGIYLTFESRYTFNYFINQNNWCIIRLRLHVICYLINKRLTYFRSYLKKHLFELSYCN